MQDLRLAVRALRATPIVTTVAVLSLALGIGANTALFSLVNSLVLRSLPVTEPQRLALISGGTPTIALGPPIQGYTYGIWTAIRDKVGIFDGACAWSSTRFDQSHGGEMNPDGLYVSGEYFRALGVSALLGRTFTAADDVRGGGKDGAVAVISYPFWQRQFGGAASVVGAPLIIDRVPFTIIGVTPPDFFGTEVGRVFDVAIPITWSGRALDMPSWYLRIMVRLKPGQSIDTATAALRGMQPQIREAAMPQLPGFREGAAEFLNSALTLAPAAAGTSALRQRYERPL